MTENKLSTNEIYTLLVNEICYLKHLPGDVLSEHLLCQRFGLSRTPVRGVLQRLQQTGYVTISSNKGTTVTSIDFNIVSQMIYQRIAVETKVLIDFIKIGNAYDIEAVNHLILESIKLKDSMDISPTDQQMMEFYDIDNNMHKVWFSSTNKLYIWDMFVRQNAHYSRFKALDMKNKQNYDELIAEHKALFDLIRNKDITGIEESLSAHLNGGVKRLGNRIFTDLSYLFVKKD
ncbi:MAG: GntR family transcriptional regulator [Clostridiales bacterium]|nr:GntR family transcriptional regulator [Clostridiales bacterium]